MSTAPVVSIIFPTTGERETVASALRSALAQTGPELEIIVVDDAPAGADWKRREPCASLLADPRVRIVPFHRRVGCAAAKNAGWAAARGTWVCYLDDDNEYLPGKVQAQHELAVRTGSPLVLCGVEYRIGRRRRRKQVDATEFRGDALLLRVLADTNLLFHRRDVRPRWEEDLLAADDACLFHAIREEHRLGVVPSVPAALVRYYSHQGPRVNRHILPHYRGLRRLLVRWTQAFSPAARRIQLCRQLLAAEKLHSGRWGRFARLATALLRVGGMREWRTIANAAFVKLPGFRRWMIT